MADHFHHISNTEMVVRMCDAVIGILGTAALLCVCFFIYIIYIYTEQKYPANSFALIMSYVVSVYSVICHCHAKNGPPLK